MGVTTTKTNKPLNPRGNDQSPLAYNRAKLYSGKALDFDGVNDDIETNAVPLPSAGAVSFYYQADATGGEIAECGGSTDDFRITINSLCGFYTGAEYRVSTSGLWPIDDKFHFVVLTWGDFGTKFYLNGQFLAENTNRPADFSSVPTTLYIGARNGSSNFLNGQIAGFKIFNTALTAAQVADLYNNPEKVVPTGVDNTALKLWLPMMEGAGTTAYDGSGNGNHGTISGATYVNGVGAPVSQSAVISWNKGSNIVVYSEKLDEWTTTFLSVTQSTATAPDGSTNAYDLNDSDSGNYGKLEPVASVAMAGDYVGSLFVKKTTGALSHYPGFDIGQPGAYVIIDTTNGTTATAGTGGIYSDVAITSYNDDWWRVSAKATINSTKLIMRIWPAISQNGTSVSTAATGINTFWGVQVEQADAIGPYVYTGATAQTTPVLLPQGLTTGRDITGVNLFENVRKQGALNLDGNSWAEVHDNASLDMTSAITLECWFYDTDEGAFEGVIGKWKDATQRTYAIIKNNGSNNFLIRISTDGSAQAGPTITNTDYGWIHLVMTYDGASIKGYKNGVYQSQAALTGSIATNDLPVEIGRYGQSTGSQYNNQIAQPRIYNRALTAEEVQRNYNAGKNTYTN